ncbi:hypothetical protein BS78_09G124600 [Paspalum vaginatum]|nr:hypothetical protein BS78_09G124600 [Paspalum vaginatum]
MGDLNKQNKWIVTDPEDQTVVDPTRKYKPETSNDMVWSKEYAVREANEQICFVLNRDYLSCVCSDVTEHTCSGSGDKIVHMNNGIKPSALASREVVPLSTPKQLLEPIRIVNTCVCSDVTKSTSSGGDSKTVDMSNNGIKNDDLVREVVRPLTPKQLLESIWRVNNIL